MRIYNRKNLLTYGLFSAFLIFLWVLKGGDEISLYIKDTIYFSTYRILVWAGFVLMAIVYGITYLIRKIGKKVGKQ